MSQNDSKNAVELWQSGVPLDKAVDVFGMQRGLTKIRQKARATALEATESSKASFRKVGKNFDDFFDAIGTIQASLAETVEVRSAKETRLFDQLRSGALVAWGFPVHHRNATEPVKVPHFMLSAEFAKWRKQSLVGHDRHFAEVTVNKPTDKLAGECDLSDAAKPAKRGPIPIGPLIAEAIEHLKIVDPNFENRAQGKRINEIGTVKGMWQVPRAAGSLRA